MSSVFLSRGVRGVTGGCCNLRGQQGKRNSRIRNIFTLRNNKRAKSRDGPTVPDGVETKMSGKSKTLNSRGSSSLVFESLLSRWRSSRPAETHMQGPSGSGNGGWLGVQLPDLACCVHPETSCSPRAGRCAVQSAAMGILTRFVIRLNLHPPSLPSPTRPPRHNSCVGIDSCS
ncbi:hypothetical protein E2C01_085624 [Portunus trituberculatus]|uniref:Uncharacterized protein n=1 Tax=Portunus trituberculatus TaxID=210409 RepID=A0A5B7JB11_PORTR|nr:hypothetical protein [Portunus trituberculatus]